MFIKSQPQIIHPEIDLVTPGKKEEKSKLEPVYPSTEKLKSKGLGGRQIGKLTSVLFTHISEKDIPENLPDNLLKSFRLIYRFNALSKIHYPENSQDFENATWRLWDECGRVL